MNHPKSTDAAVVVVGIGEALFDCFPHGEVLGGAPVNAAVHTHQLLSPEGGRAITVSRVGHDPLGDRVIDELQQRGMETAFIQRDPSYPTGYVRVSLDSTGHPEYYFPDTVAWDQIAFQQSLERLAANAQAVCFGTLAQRCATSRDTIQRFLTAASGAIRLFDVNLRQTFYTAQIVENSLRAASAVKLNEEELRIVSKLVHLNSAKGPDDEGLVWQLCDRFDLKLVALTRGARGTVLYANRERVEGNCEPFPPALGADSVGAGDACCAGLLYGMLHDWRLEETLSLANRLGAFVASCPGATPTLPAELIPARMPDGNDGQRAKTRG